MVATSGSFHHEPQPTNCSLSTFHYPLSTFHFPLFTFHFSLSTIHPHLGTDLDRAARLLQQGALVAIPTETVYGLAANAFAPRAVQKIFEAKNRPQFNPLIVHTHDLAAVAPALGPLPPLVASLAAQFWPGPLTLLLPRTARIPDLVTAGHPRVAIRIPAHPLTLALLRRLDFPLAAPSANPFGYISPTTAAHVAAQLGDRVSYILDGGPAQVGIESTILGLEPDGRLRLYRRGGLALEAIEALAGPILPPATGGDSPQASGMLKSHYAPDTPLILGDLVALAARYPQARLGVLAFQRNPFPNPPAHLELLSPRGDLGEAARHLFAALRRLDQAGVDYILAEPVPAHGLGPAINDRLQKAEAERKG